MKTKYIYKKIMNSEYLTFCLLKNRDEKVINWINQFEQKNGDITDIEQHLNIYDSYDYIINTNSNSFLIEHKFIKNDSEKQLYIKDCVQIVDLGLGIYSKLLKKIQIKHFMNDDGILYKDKINNILNDFRDTLFIKHKTAFKKTIEKALKRTRQNEKIYILNSNNKFYHYDKLNDLDIKINEIELKNTHCFLFKCDNNIFQCRIRFKNGNKTPAFCISLIK